MLRQVRTLKDVVDWGLCTGCGACHSHCRKGEIRLVNIPSIGIRPHFDSEACANCTGCLSICPGYHVDASPEPRDQPSWLAGDEAIGVALEIWEGHASDPELRHKGSSGGVLSALALYCLEREKMNGVLHSRAEEGHPLGNTTVVSSTRDELLAGAGSRYAPAAPCEGLKRLEEMEGSYVFIGKPCDAAAVAMLRQQRKDLDRRLGLVLTFFCAGTPSTQGTLDLLKAMDVNPEDVDTLRYRGEGWPGNFRVISNGGSREASLTYSESWSRLTGYRPLRCNLCPDGLGRVADISCGDAWHTFAQNGGPGTSLVIVRTRRGQEIVRRALAAQYVSLRRVGTDAVHQAQPGLLQRRTEVFGRLLGLRLLMIPTPKFRKFSLVRSWFRLPFRRKATTIVGTARRAIVRGWWRARPIQVVRKETAV